MKPKILMIENDPDDRVITADMFQMEGLDAELDFVTSKELAGYVQNKQEKPQLILLDFNAQPHNAFDLIKYIRASAGYQSIPLIVLSDSEEPADIQKCYSLGINSFIKKPDDYAGTVFKIKAFINYWFRLVQLPSTEEPATSE